MPELSDGKLNQILKETSRAFYLSLAILPEYSRRPLSLAYLLARAADTVADSESSGLTSRQKALRGLQDSLLEPGKSVELDLGDFRPAHQGEARLLAEVPQLYREFTACQDEDRHIIAEVVHTLIDGMLWDQEMFEQNLSEDGLTEEQLERYTYLVAGCVGPFWSRVCAGPDPAMAGLLSEPWIEIAVEFGKALQWVNILRDIPKDQEKGRYYLPSLQREDFGPAFSHGCRRALGALSTATPYPLQFPRRRMRDRIATFLPLVLGLRTLEKLLADGGPRPERRVKVTRKEVLAWMAASPAILLSDSLYRILMEKLHQRAGRALEIWENTNL